MFPSQFAKIFSTYQTFVTNLHLPRVELRFKLQEKLHRVTGPLKSVFISCEFSISIHATGFYSFVRQLEKSRYDRGSMDLLPLTITSREKEKSQQA